MSFDVTKIEDKIDRAAAGAVTVNSQVGGISFQNMMEVMEFSKLMAVSDVAVPPYLRGNPGACLAICIQALEWRMSPFAVANKSYKVTNKGVDRIAYESQLIHAVIEARAPLKNRLRHEILGEGDDRTCKVWGTFKGEATPHSYTSETLGKIIADIGRNEYGQVKGSPLWERKPEVQMFYSTSRDWARMHCPDVLLGIYAEDEFPTENPKDVTPKSGDADAGLAARLDAKKKARNGKKSKGFDPDHVEREVGAVKDAAANGTKPVDVVEVAQTDSSTDHQQSMLDIMQEPERTAFHRGAQAETGSPLPSDLTGKNSEADAWIEGYRSVNRDQENG